MRELLLLVLVAGVGLPPPAALGAQAEKLRLYVLDCGTIVPDDLSMFSLSREEVSSVPRSVPCFLVVHSRGVLLWDAGLPDSWIDHPDGLRQGPFLYRVKRTLESQLSALGYPPARVSHIAFSHLHLDHAGNANLFAGSLWLVQRPEWEIAFRANPEEPPFFDPRYYSRLRDARTLVLDGDHDVFGDGRVALVAAPGHTPGHQVLLVDLADTGPVLLAGDLYHFAASRRLRRVPSFNFDREESFASIDRIEALVKARKAQLWIHHESRNLGLRTAPAFYE